MGRRGLASSRSGHLRIIAGSAKGRRLIVPSGAVRPTPDRVREALFSILSDKPQGARVLDACAGSGALGLEAASRGAAYVLLVERDRRVLEVLRANVERCDLEGVHVLCGDVRKAAPSLAEGQGGPFDIALIDPPFALDEGGRIADGLAAGGALAPQALVVIEHRAEAAPSPSGLRIIDQRRYGSVGLVFCENEA